MLSARIYITLVPKFEKLCRHIRKIDDQKNNFLRGSFEGYKVSQLDNENIAQHTRTQFLVRNAYVTACFMRQVDVYSYFV